MQRLSEIAVPLHLDQRRLEQLRTAIAEATMNAMEHGNHYQADLPVHIEVLASDRALAVRISDKGGPLPTTDPQLPNLEAKLAELQTPRGWGLFLIKNLVDEMRILNEAQDHTIELLMYRDQQGAEHGDETA